MTIIRVPKQMKEFITQDPNHPRLTRRDFVQRGMATGVMSLILPKLIMGSAISKAYGSAASCTPAAGAKGALAQIFCNGGPTMTARFLSDTMAELAAGSAVIATNYGVDGTKLMKLGPNLNISSTSPFGATLLAGPGGSYTAQSWLAVLKKLSGGGHSGAFNADDGGGSNLGQIGASSSFKNSVLGQDIRLGNNVTLAPWSIGVPSLGVSGNATPATFNTALNLTPATTTTGMTPAIMTNTATASDSLNGIFNTLFGTSQRKAGTNLATAATCGFYNDSVQASSTYAASLFNPTNITLLNTNVVNGNITQAEQALLAAYYQSATGNAAGVFLEVGDDYHGQSGNNIAASDIEAARAIVMFLAACDQAKTKGSLIMSANGIAGAGNNGGNGATNGLIPVTANIGGTSMNVNAPGAEGDAGGFFNVGQLICYDPAGSPPTLITTGTFNTSSGSVVANPVAGSVGDALAGLYLTAFMHLGLSTSTLASKISTNGFATTTNLLIG